jgi:hypothetical protein
MRIFSPFSKNFLMPLLRMSEKKQKPFVLPLSSMRYFPEDEKKNEKSSLNQQKVFSRFLLLEFQRMWRHVRGTQHIC